MMIQSRSIARNPISFKCQLFRAYVVARVRGTCRGTCSESMLWDVFEAYVVEDVVGLCFGMCSGPIFWDMVGAYVLGHGRGLYCGMCSPLMLWKVPRAHVLQTHVLDPVLGLCCETCSGSLLSDVVRCLSNVNRFFIYFRWWGGVECAG